jgi:2-methylcitrate dehydratase PrpD
MTDAATITGATVAETLAEAALAARPDAAVRETCERLLIDIIGLCVAARRTDYVAATIGAAEGEGPCTAFGHAGGLGASDAAIVNGTASHGEDYDDTFEGGPIHSGVVVVPAVLAAAERFGLAGADVLRGIAVGAEAACRLSTVVPKAVHKSGFHPTCVFGAPAAALAVATAMRLTPRQVVDALGIAGSMSSGIIEYLTDGAWTKRLHPGWAAQAGIRAALLARGGFFGPRTVFEGPHGLFHGFARTTEGHWPALLDGFGRDWVAATIAFKPWANGTMVQPYVDCALRLARRGVRIEDVASVTCETAEGILHRLWEPLAAKQAPPNAYSAKFSVPYGVAAGLALGGAGLDAFTEARVAEPRLRDLCARVSYVVDPANPYPAPIPAMCAPCCATGRWLRSGRPICAAAPPTRCRAPRSRPRRAITVLMAAGTPRGRMRWSPSARAPSTRRGSTSRRSAAEMERELAGRVALVTGAGRNIGRAIALELAAAGAAVVVNVRANAAEAEAVAAEIAAAGGRAVALPADVADRAAVDAMLAEVARRFGRLDILVNNAAIRAEAPFAELTSTRGGTAWR